MTNIVTPLTNLRIIFLLENLIIIVASIYLMLGDILFYSGMVPHNLVVTL